MDYNQIALMVNDLLLQRGNIDHEIQRLRAAEEQRTTALLYVLSKAGYVCQKSHMFREGNALIVHVLPASHFTLKNWGRVKHKMNDVGLKVEWSYPHFDDPIKGTVVTQIMVNFDPMFMSDSRIEQIIKEAYKAKEKRC